MLIETMQLEVMQNDPESQIFDKFLANVHSVTWYVHMGLTRDVINYSYSSTSEKNTNNSHHTHTPELINNDNSKQNRKNIKEESKKNKNENKDNYKLCIIKEKDLLTDKRYKYNYNRSKKSKKEYAFHKLDKGIHFNSIPVVDYDENTNNSFVWQRIPENDNYYKETYEEMDYISYQRDRENVMNDDHDNNINEMENINDNINEENNIEGVAEPPVLPKFNWVNLSESAYKQSGFILKAVIKGILT